MTIRFHKLIQESSPSKTFSSFLASPYLTECNGDLLLVLVSFFTHNENVTGIRLFREDLSTKAWTEVKRSPCNFSRQNACFFLFKLWCGADIKGNCIYFVETDDRSLYTYSLQDQSITMTLPCHISATFTTSESDDSLWFSIPPITNKKNFIT